VGAAKFKNQLFENAKIHSNIIYSNITHYISQSKKLFLFPHQAPILSINKYEILLDI